MATTATVAAGEQELVCCTCQGQFSTRLAVARHSSRASQHESALPLWIGACLSYSSAHQAQGCCGGVIGSDDERILRDAVCALVASDSGMPAAEQAHNIFSCPLPASMHGSVCTEFSDQVLVLLRFRSDSTAPRGLQLRL